MNKILIPKNLDEEGIENILKEFVKPSNSTHLDFSDTEFISPFASILLILMIDNAVRKNSRKIHFILKISVIHPYCLRLQKR